MQVTRGRDVARQTSGFVVQADRFNGYIVTNAEAVAGADSLTVTVPGTGGRLVAQVVRSDLSNDYALLKVNGLDLPALEFARQEPSSGEVVWTAAKVCGSEKVSLSKGLLRTESSHTTRPAGTSTPPAILPPVVRFCSTNADMFLVSIFLIRPVMAVPAQLT